ncbi:MAG: SDR family oxidoreductase [Acidobacteria bacterium]|nr:SDR family oxidoreductase [Acidobacteriota bacterium]
MSTPRFHGKTVLVTGAATGIGRAIAVRFASEGANVAINYRDKEGEVADTAAQCRAAYVAAGVEDAAALPFQADVSVEPQVQAMVAAAVERFGRLDVMVNNAGVQTQSPSDETEMAAFDWVLNVNLRGAFLCARAAIRHFLERGGGGVVLNNSSVHEIIPKPQYASYSISKGGMENMTRTLALEYAGRGIRVNAVGPGAIVTPINSSWIDNPALRAQVESHIPMGRAGAPEEIAAVFAFLASDEASYITGQTIFACGGLTLFPEYRGTWAS